MKVKILVLILFLLSLVCFAAAKPNYNEYTEVIRKMYQTNENSKVLLDNWKEGVRDSYEAEVDHLKLNFEFVKGYDATDGKVVVTGILTITAYCIKDNAQIRISQLLAMAYLFNKDKKIEKSLKIKEGDQHVLEMGWYGVPV